MKDEDARLDELLAGGTLGGPHYDQIFERVVQRTESDEARWRPSRRRWWAVAAVGLVPAAAAWLILARSETPAPTPKGAAGVSGAIEIGCGAAAGHVCHPGETLMFSVNAAVASGYLAAYAEPIGEPGAERIWYFPVSAGGAPFVAAGQGTVIVPDGIRIGPEHRPGRYRVTVWLANRPPTRAGEAMGETETHGTFELEVAP